MPNVLPLFGNRVAKSGLIREIEVLARVETLEPSATGTDSELLAEEVLYMETYDVHVSELICPATHATHGRENAEVFSIVKS